ncbi:MAG: Phosphatidylserine decarboxylase proenzyme [Verrucomicrobiae bacterium]|nr:Phosphatidylserine decarboxylase proenzyme [Verrucomicrobiae bacterium]
MILVLLILAGAGVYWRCWPAAAVSVVLLVFTISFFRDPTAAVPADAKSIVAPATGKIVEIKPVGDTTMVAIFLSIFDVHVQRSPVAGTIKRVQYQAGKFLDVRNPNASAQNEFRLLEIEMADGYRVTVRQIAGLIARRIVGWADEGATLEKGERLGMIRFGSRVEICVPAGTEIVAKIGDHAKGGETILAKRP